MCEGPNELKIINLLLENDKLKFSYDDLLDMRPFHARQLSSPILKPALNSYHDELKIYRIGDTLTESLKIPKELSPLIISQQKFCTKPELEMLLIIAENKVSEYEKVKTKQKPKEFCKQTITYKKRRYDNSTIFYELYFQDRINLLLNSIKEYRRTHSKHKFDEEYLFDLLKN